MHFLVVGLSHKTAPLDVRERFALSSHGISDLLGRLLQEGDVREGMLVSTCNRVEAYLVSKHIPRGTEAVLRLFSELGEVDAETLERHLYVKENGEAVAHLFRVTASLDSLIVGEPQISGQIKEAYAQAVQCQSTGVYLNKLIHQALHVSKKIRSETGIGRLPVSVSYAAVVLAEKIFGHLNQHKVLLLGTGEMGALAARHLAERRVQEILLANRTGEKAEEIARELGGRVVPFEELSERLEEVDIVIASTAAAEPIIRGAQVQEAMRRRKMRPMFFIDIAVPRNIDPEVNRLENVYLYDIDDLQGIVESNRKEREREAQRAEGMIQEEVVHFLEYLEQRGVSPTIRQLSNKFDRIRRQELEKFRAKHRRLSEEDYQSLEACTRAIVNKILHEPIIQMKSQESQGAKDGSPKYSEILRKLFKLE